MVTKGARRASRRSGPASRDDRTELRLLLGDARAPRHRPAHRQPRRRGPRRRHAGVRQAAAGGAAQGGQSSPADRARLARDGRARHHCARRPDRPRPDRRSPSSASSCSRGFTATRCSSLLASAGGWLLERSAQGSCSPALGRRWCRTCARSMSLSFPSGHALTSAAVFLTLGALLMRVAKRRLLKFYCMFIAMTGDAARRGHARLPRRPLSDRRAGGLADRSVMGVVCLLLEREAERRYGLKKERAEAS